MMRGGAGKGPGLFVLYLITGMVLGGIVGELLAGTAPLASLTPYLIRTFTIFSLPPVDINLYVIKLVVGFTLQPSLISILGMILAIVLFRKF